MFKQKYRQQSGKTLFIILIVGAFMVVIIGFSFGEGAEGRKFSPDDERNRFAAATDSADFNQAACQKITEDIRTSLNQSPLSQKAKEVYVTAVDGVIVVSGRVDSSVEKEEVLKLSRDHAGKVRVDDLLKVVPEN